MPTYVCMILSFILFGVLGIMPASLGILMSTLVFLPFLSFGLCLLYLYYGISCPHCGGKVAYLTYLPKGGVFKLSMKIKYCPFCGADFNKELPNAHS